MSYITTKHDNEIVEITIRCKRKNAVVLNQVLNTVRETYELRTGETDWGKKINLDHQEDFLNHYRNPAYKSLMDCRFTNDINKHFNNKDFKSLLHD